MNWEETIKYIRGKEEYAYLVEKAYLEEDLNLNIHRFRQSIEYSETLKLVKNFAPNATSILDIGCGNGISCVAFALDGFSVTAVEPDPSETVGAGAIRKLKEKLKLDNLEVYESFAEDINFDSNSFDVVYVRQAMHHAHILNKFIKECGRVLKKGGILLTIRDHVIYDPLDKEKFLESHPLQKYYGGENAFTQEEYKKAMTLADLEVLQTINFYGSPINYFPKPDENSTIAGIKKLRKSYLEKKIGKLAMFKIVFALYNLYLGPPLLDETIIPGRMYSFICRKR